MDEIKFDGFGHERGYEGGSNDWITPKYIIDALGPFDLDPCASVTQPWSCARKAYTVEQDGLAHYWFGSVWLNPPYGPHTSRWVRRLSEHGHGIALIFARVETKLWHDFIFPTMDGLVFPRSRISFHRPDGSLPKSSSGAPSAIIAWGNDERSRLIEAVDQGAIAGAYFDMPFYSGSRRR